jgi:hypothetical protein
LAKKKKKKEKEKKNRLVAKPITLIWYVLDFFFPIVWKYET